MQGWWHKPSQQEGWKSKRSYPLQARVGARSPCESTKTIKINFKFKNTMKDAWRALAPLAGTCPSAGSPCRCPASARPLDTFALENFWPTTFQHKTSTGAYHALAKKRIGSNSGLQTGVERDRGRDLMTCAGHGYDFAGEVIGNISRYILPFVSVNIYQPLFPFSL